ncbi:unnamed protein product, partial [Brassica napus]
EKGEHAAVSFWCFGLLGLHTKFGCKVGLGSFPVASPKLCVGGRHAPSLLRR